jgi:multidrug transporter EmrE-like cation transporter
MRVLQTVVLILSHMGFATLAGVGFKLSAASTTVRSFWLWQVAGNIAGFSGVLILTTLMRLVPLHVAYPVTQGLTVVGVQVFAARLLFREVIQPGQWLGTVLVIAGIVLISIYR